MQGTGVDRDRHPPVSQQLFDPHQLDTDNVVHLGPPEALEEDHFVQPVQKLWPEMAADHVHHHGPHLLDVLALGLGRQEL